MTTSKTSTYQESSKLKMQTGKQSTSVPHVSQPNSTQATIALAVSNSKHAKLKNQQTQTCKTSKSSSSNYCLSPTHLPTCQQLKSLHSHFSWVMTPYYSNCKHNFQVLSVSWPRSSFRPGRIPVFPQENGCEIQIHSASSKGITRKSSAKNHLKFFKNEELSLSGLSEVQTGFQALVSPPYRQTGSKTQNTKHSYRQP